MIHRVASRWLKKRAFMETALDGTIRARVLEIVAEVPKNSWTRHPPTGLRQAREWFQNNYGVELEEAWTDPRGKSIYIGMLNMAKRITGNTDDAEEVVQNIIGEMSTRHAGGALGNLADKQGKKIKTTGGGYNAVNSILIHHTKHRAGDITRKSRGQERNRQQVAPIKVNITPGQVAEGVPHDVPSVRLQSPGGSYHRVLTRSSEGRRFWELLLKKMGLKYKASHVDIFRDRIEYGKKDMTNRALAEKYGISGSAVGSILKKLSRGAAEIVAADPKLRDFADQMQMEEVLGFGGSHQRLSSKVANRFLAK